MRQVDRAEIKPRPANSVLSSTNSSVGPDAGVWFVNPNRRSLQCNANRERGKLGGMIMLKNRSIHWNRVLACAIVAACLAGWCTPVGAQSYDMGDAPQSYTPDSVEPAAHEIDTHFRLGYQIDGEPRTLFDRYAMGDDLDNIDDEDGVVFLSPLIPGQEATVAVTTSAAGLVSAWIDWNGDGTWLPWGLENPINQWRIPSMGRHLRTIRVPESARPNIDTFARFRFSTSFLTGLHGVAPNGEVEDYMIHIGDKMTTAITYHGQLLHMGAPAEGQFDLEFTPYDSASGGNIVASPVVVENKPVAGGTFAVELDFGSDVFTGEPRWMEIGVRPGDSDGEFTALSPRPEITPSPYALQTRGIFVDAAENIGIGTTSPMEKLSVVTAKPPEEPAAPPKALGDADDLGPMSTAIAGMSLDFEYGTGLLGVATGMDGVGVLGSFIPGGSVVSAAIGGAGVVGQAVGEDSAAKNAAPCVGVIGLSYGFEDVCTTPPPVPTGVYGAVAYENGIGVYGVASKEANSKGVKGESQGTHGVGVLGNAIGEKGVGVKGTTSSSDGYGVSGKNDADKGVAVCGENEVPPGFRIQPGGGAGVLGQSGKDEGKGVYGVTTGAEGDGVRGEAEGEHGFGVIGLYKGKQSDGVGVYGSHTESPPDPNKRKMFGGIGVVGESDDPNGTGVIGLFHPRASEEDPRGPKVPSGTGVGGIAIGGSGSGVWGTASGEDAAGIVGTHTDGQTGRLGGVLFGVESAGNLVVKNGAYQGDISSSSGSDGAPFPRPAYNSGWRTTSVDSSLILSHDIGALPQDLVVEVMLKESGLSTGIHSIDMLEGAYWHDLTANTIKVFRGSADPRTSWLVRVRIWVVK